MQQSFGPSGEAPAIRTTNDDDLRVGKENRECSTDSSDEERFGVPPPEGVRTTSAMSGVKESLAEPEIPGLWEDGWKEPKGELISENTLVSIREPRHMCSTLIHVPQLGTL